MNRTKFPFQQMTLVCTITLALVSFTQLPAQPDQPLSNNPHSSRMRFVQPTLAKEQEPDNRGTPTEREGAGTRGDCPSYVDKPPLTGLVPLMQRTLANNREGIPSPLEKLRTLANNREGIPSPLEKFVLGLTVEEYPTFWFYVPYSPDNIHSVNFVLQDEKENSITKKPIPITLSGTPGVVSFRLPISEKPLEIGKYYHWYFLIDCKPQSLAEDIAAEGLVQRLEANSDLKHQLESATPWERIALYAEKGIWQDAVTLLGDELRRTKPKDATLDSKWAELLGSIELENIATEPIVQCCNL